MFLKEAFIYTREYNGFSAAGLLKMIKGEKVKWVVDMQHTPYYYYDDSRREDMMLIKKLIYRPLGLIYIIRGRIFLRRADLVSAMSYDYDEGFARIFEREFSVPREKIFPIPNGVDLKLIEKVKKSEEKCNLNVPDSGVKFVYAGNVRLERLKMLKEFIETFRERTIDAALIICGAMPVDSMMSYKKIKTDYFIHMGLVPHSELLKLYKEVDVVLAFIDGFMRDHDYSHPGKVFEAMAMGKLVVVNNLSSIGRVVKDGYNGLMFESSNIGEICDRVFDILSNPEMKKQIEGNAEKSIEFLDWELIHQKWFSAIQEMLSR
ncbi:MAG: glycosyltransferase [Candidatus Omnitrophota bacterium]